MDLRDLATVRELARRDAELAAEVRRLQTLATAAERVRERAEAIKAFFAGYREEVRRRQAAIEGARQELGARREDVARAEEDLARARNDDERRAADAALTRARDRTSAAERRLELAQSELAQLERQAAELQREVPELEEAARRIGRDLPEPPADPNGLDELIDWASRARATIFVASGRLETERERVIREAVELGSTLLGEPLYGANTHLVRERVERAFDATLRSPPS